ncbi:hypothetical protein [Spirosoma arcticum]
MTIYLPGSNPNVIVARRGATRDAVADDEDVFGAVQAIGTDNPTVVGSVAEKILTDR